MSPSPHSRDSPIQTTGIWLFGGLSIVLGMGKLLGLWGGSWWRMGLPILVYAVFNGFYIGIGFLYLSVKPVRERPAAVESALLGHYRDGVSYGSGFVFVVGFVLNLISRLEGADASDRWWLFSGRVAVLIVFGVFSAISLWLYWSGIGQVLGHEEDDEF
jgi:hypothetical protein